MSKPMPAVRALSEYCSGKERVAFHIVFLAVVLARVYALSSEVYESMMSITYHEQRIGSIVMSVAHFHSNLIQLNDAHAYVMLAVVLWGSLLLPIMRFCAMLWAYEIRPTSAKWRSQVIYFQDVVGRFMLVEFYGTLFTAVFFQTDALNMVQGLDVKMRTRLRPVFFIGLASNIVSTLLTHYQMYVDDVARRERAPDKEIRFKLCAPHRHLIHFTNLVIVLCLINLLVFNTTLAWYEMTGFVGRALPRNLRVDLLTSFRGFAQSLEPDQRAMAFVACAMDAMLCVFIPLGIYLAWLVLCYYEPLSPNAQAKLSLGIKRCMSFLSLDVFAMLCIANYFNVDQVVQFVFTDKTPALCRAMSRFAHEECAGIQVEFGNGMFTLLGLCLAFAHVRYCLDTFDEQRKDKDALEAVYASIEEE